MPESNFAESIRRSPESVHRYRLRLLLLASCFVTISGASGADTTVYEYDALGRLIVETKDNGTVVYFDLDAAGNRESKTTASSGSPPNAVNDSATVVRFVQKSVNLIANDSDPDGDPLTIVSVTSPNNAYVTIGQNGTVNIVGTYAPYGSSSFATFTYTITDGNGGTDTATVSLTVTYW